MDLLQLSPDDKTHEMSEVLVLSTFDLPPTQCPEKEPGTMKEPLSGLISLLPASSSPKTPISPGTSRSPKLHAENERIIFEVFEVPETPPRMRDPSKPRKRLFASLEDDEECCETLHISPQKPASATLVMTLPSSDETAVQPSPPSQPSQCLSPARSPNDVKQSVMRQHIRLLESMAYNLEQQANIFNTQAQLLRCLVEW